MDEQQTTTTTKRRQRVLARVTGLFEKVAKPQNATVTLEGEGDHAMLCVRVLHGRKVYRRLLKDVAHSLVESAIVEEVAANPVKPRRKYMAKRGLLKR